MAVCLIVWIWALVYTGFTLSILFGLRRIGHGRSSVTPTVSVVVAARNEADNIGRCVESLRAQDYNSELYEVIVADDRSHRRHIRHPWRSRCFMARSPHDPHRAYPRWRFTEKACPGCGDRRGDGGYHPSDRRRLRGSRGMDIRNGTGVRTRSGICRGNRAIPRGPRSSQLVRATRVPLERGTCLGIHRAWAWNPRERTQHGFQT